MKKNAFYLILFTLSACLCFLAACGSGEIVDLSSQGSQEWAEINKTLDNLTDGNSLIAKCQDPAQRDDTDCPSINPVYSSSEEDYDPPVYSSSSFGEEISSDDSGGNPPPGDNSSQSNQTSSNSGAATPSSSSIAATTPSSSSVATTTPSSSSVAATTPSSSSLAATTPSSSSVATTTPSSSSVAATTPSSSSVAATTPSSSSTTDTEKVCGPNYGTYDSSIAVGNCIDLTQNCTTGNNLPLKIYNYNSQNGYWTGTIYCSDNSSKTIECSTNNCEESACAAGTNGAWLLVTAIDGNGGGANSNCW